MAVRPPRRRRRRAPPPSWAGPFLAWYRHPWAAAWIGVIVVPWGLLALRVVDEAAGRRAVTAVAAGFLLLFTLTLVRGLWISAVGSTTRALAGFTAALAALALAVAMTLAVDLGPVSCPSSMGADTGADVAMAVIQAWHDGRTAAIHWTPGKAGDAWGERLARSTLLDYRPLASGCWNRPAPIATTRTWHDYRVTVHEPPLPPVMRRISIWTVRSGPGWRVAAIESSRN